MRAVELHTFNTPLASRMDPSCCAAQALLHEGFFFFFFFFFRATYECCPAAHTPHRQQRNPEYRQPQTGTSPKHTAKHPPTRTSITNGPAERDSPTPLNLGPSAGKGGGKRPFIRFFGHNER